MSGSLIKKCIIATMVIAGALLLYGRYSNLRTEGARMEHDLQRIQEHLQEHKREPREEPSGFQHPKSRSQ